MAQKIKRKLAHVVKIRDLTDLSEGSGFYLSLIDDALDDRYPGLFTVNWEHETVAPSLGADNESCDVIVFGFSDPDAAFAFKMRWR